MYFQVLNRLLRISTYLGRAVACTASSKQQQKRKKRCFIVVVPEG